ncbi:hypothetical protein GEMRC1_009503 [Eukaryota sp. GEM-RC1]
MSSPHTSLPANSLLAEQVRFVAPKLSSLSTNAVARFIQEPSRTFLLLNQEEEIEIMIHAALREVRPEGFDPKTFAAYWSAAKEATVNANPSEPTSTNSSSFYSSSTSVPTFLNDDTQKMKSKFNRSTSNTSQSSSSLHQLDDWDDPSFFDNPPLPEGFHRFILPDVLSLIRFMSPHSCNSQESLWKYLLQQIEAKDASEARMLLRSLSMNAPGHEALTRYLQEFQKTANRCCRFIDTNRPKPLLESFILGLKPDALKYKILDEFRLNLIRDVESLISRTLEINNTLVSDKPQNKPSLSCITLSSLQNQYNV